MFSVASLLTQLEEPEDKIRIYALKKIFNIVDEHWAEISDNLAVIEALSEDSTFPETQLAAGVTSRVFFHLEEYEDALRLALLSGKYFDVSKSGDYEVTMVGKCVEKYIEIRKNNNTEGEDVSIDNKLDSIVESMFENCYNMGTFSEALGIALEAHRLDKVELTLVRSGEQISRMLTHCMDVAHKLVDNRPFRREVYSLIVKLFESQPSDKCNYIELASCLHYLKEVDKFASLLKRLIDSDSDSALIAFQIAFDLMELQDQRFVEELLTKMDLPAPKTDNNVDDKSKTETKDDNSSNIANDSPEILRARTLHEILREGLSAAMYLDFLYRNNKTDNLILKNIKAGVDIGRKSSVLHSAAIVAHGYLQAGTTVDVFLRDNLDWLGRASNWAKFSATASLGVIHKGNIKPSMTLLQPYLPNNLAAGVSSSPYSESGAMYALGLIHACTGGDHKTSDNGDQDILSYLVTSMEASAHQENELARETLQHGTCLGIGLTAMSSGDQSLANKMLDVVYNDNAVAGDAAALAIGMILLGGGSKHAELLENMLSYSKDTGHEKITRSLGLSAAMIMYGQEEVADTLIEQLVRDKSPLLRYGGMFSIGMAYIGTASNKAIRKLLHVAVSDVDNNVRRAAVISLGFVVINVPERLPELIALLSGSYNPHVRYGAAMALAIGCSHQSEEPKEALQLLDHLKKDKVDFVRQGALIACSMLLMQQNPETNSRAKELRTKLSDTIADAKHSSTMTRMGAIMGMGIIDAGGRNVTLELISRDGFSKPPAVIGMMLWAQYWYWYPMMHLLSLSFTPTALIGVNDQLDLPINFQVDCEKDDLKEFNYPKPLKEKKEKKQTRVKTAVLSTTAKARAREALKKSDSNPAMEIDDDVDLAAADNKNNKNGTKDNDKNDDDKTTSINLSNPLRVTRAQSQFIRFKENDQRYTPVYLNASHKTGIVVLKNNDPGAPEEVVKIAVPPTSGDNDDGEEEVKPPKAFEWTEPQ